MNRAQVWLCLVVASLLATSTSTVLSQDKAQSRKKKSEWVVPGKFKKIPNPVKADPASIAAGNKVYIKECLTCHGKTGVGDGAQAKDLEVEVGNLRYDIASQSDGQLYFKISKGKKPMPEFIKTLKPAERWQVINYIRTLHAGAPRWIAPEEFRNKPNPVAADSPSIEAGQEAYSTHCLSCHGEKGTGDGVDAKKQNLGLGDLGRDLKDRSDGELFWKLSEDHAPTPEFWQTLDETTWWHLINYVRTFG